MIIPVIRKGDEEKGIIWLDIDKVTHLVRTRKEVEFHTSNGVYVLPNALEYWKETLKEKGFERLDWGVLANLNRIADLDEKEQTIFFKDSEKGIVVARRHIQKLKEFFGSRRG